MSFNMGEISIELSFACPMKCSFCSSGAGFPSPIKNESSCQKIKEVLTEAKKHCGAVNFSLSGGEPAIYPELSEVLDHAYRLGYNILFYTSGSVFNKKQDDIEPLPDSLVKKLANFNNNGSNVKVIFDTQGCDAKSVDKLMGVSGAFDNLLSSIKKCVTAKLDVQGHMVPLRNNVSQTFETAKMMGSLGASCLSFLRAVPQGRVAEHKEMMLSKQEFRNLQYMFLYMIKNKKDFGIDIRIGHPIDFTFLIDQSRPVRACRGGISDPLIEPDGRMVMCPSQKWMQTCAGNVREKNITDLWFNSKFYNIFRNFIKDGWRNMTGACKDCVWLSLCKGKCLSQRVYAYGTRLPFDEAVLIGPDPLCFVNDM